MSRIGECWEGLIMLFPLTRQSDRAIQNPDGKRTSSRSLDGTMQMCQHEAAVQGKLLENWRTKVAKWVDQTNVISRVERRGLVRKREEWDSDESLLDDECAPMKLGRVWESRGVE